jgi:hypothetical protein
MRVTSNRELARHLAVSETAVRRAEKAGRIKRDADGAWDLAKVKAAWSDNTDQAHQRPKPGARERSGTRAPMKPVPEAALGAVRDTLREHGEPIVAGPGQAMTFMQARTANEVLKAQERRLRLQQMKSELATGRRRSRRCSASPVRSAMPDLEFAYTLSAQSKLVLTAHEVYLPKAKLAVEGPGGVQASFDFRGAKNTAAGRMFTVMLTNDLDGAVYA